MAGELLLVGSVPLDTPEQVMRMFGTPLGPFLDYLPDGEVGDRRWWVLRLSWQVFLGHPELELLKRPAPDNGVERLVPRDRSDAYAFRVRPGVEVVRFGDPGWRLGFTRDAVSSYFVFKTALSGFAAACQQRHHVAHFPDARRSGACAVGL
jgi:hypothetical protein